jgi:GDP-L-fucose synthase
MSKYNKVLVTGGYGFVGSRLRLIRPDWHYMSSADCDITDARQLKRYLSDLKPDAIVHLAAHVGGIKESTENQSQFYYLNSLINLNLIHQAYEAGIPRVLSCLSTCCFPDASDKYPMTEEDFMKGEPTETNYCYGIAKRGMYIQSKWYTKEYGVMYNTFTPSNIYGPGNNSTLQRGHLISSMIKKFDKAQEGDTITFWSDGTPLRQHLYVDDLAYLIPEMLEKHLTDLPLIVAPDENLSIRGIVETFQSIISKKVNFDFNNYLSGQHRKDASSEKLIELIPDFKFTTLKEGLKETLKWYNDHK